MTASTHPSLNVHRQQFPALANKAYFNFGGQGPMPQSAINAIQQAHHYMQQAGPFSGEVNRWVVQEGQQLREALAIELGIPASTLTLTEDVSIGCNIALWGLDWRSGDHLLLSDCEHPGIVAAAHEISRRFGVEVTVCPLMATLNQGDPVTVLADHLRPSTRLVIVSHILWNTGQVLPLREIMQLCHTAQATPVRVLVDAAQSVGMLPLDLDALDVDFYAFTGHKWLCGPAGVGGLYVSADARELLRPTFIGWRSITKNAMGHPTGWQPDGSRYEIATSDYALYSGLKAALGVHRSWGTGENRYRRILDLSQLLWQRLRDLPQVVCLRTAPPESGLVSFQIGDCTPATHERFVQALEQQGFLLRTILDPTCVRACVHYFTSEAEIEQLVAAIQNIGTL
ncbi:MAG: aminotransferase class V-fold PLP-dependent enzyme [Synechococcales cyanobacterium C42_A2020_086]|jgi:L-cysteine/cystine lyase|nr:aminotransferase class V-fold PLP-dependent enzyme [Synechococcales cyanobacterium C42_A2020_086]